MAKVLISYPVLACLAQIWAPKICFVDFSSTSNQTLFQAIILCIYWKTNEPNLRKWPKAQFRASFLLLWPKCGPPKKIFRRFYLFQMLETVASYHCTQFQEKLMKEASENGKKNLVLDTILAPLAQIQFPKFFFVDFTCTRCQALLQATIVCNFKEN